MRRKEPAPSRFVLMNPGKRAGMGTVPRPTQPVDDFSIALWAFAEFALEKNGLELADITYWGGHPITPGPQTWLAVRSRDKSGEALPTAIVAQIVFYPDAHRYKAACALDTWPPSAGAFLVQADGALLIHARRRGSFTLERRKVGNLLTWKFSPRAFLVPRAAEVAAPIERRHRI